MNINKHLPVIVVSMVVLIVVLVGGKMIYDYGRYQAGFDVVDSEQEANQLSQQVDQLQQQLVKLREETVRLESAQTVDSHANSVVRDNLGNLQQEIMELREELQFYRSIVSPTKGQPGVNIHNFKINQGEKDREYHYNLTLIHIQGQKKHHRQASGVVNLSIEGEQDGAQKSLTLKQVAEPKKSARMKFSFKYFRRFEGSIILPVGFIPQGVVVQVVPSSKKIDGDKKKIEWPDVLN